MHLSCDIGKGKNTRRKLGNHILHKLNNNKIILAKRLLNYKNIL